MNANLDTDRQLAGTGLNYALEHYPDGLVMVRKANGDFDMIGVDGQDGAYQTIADAKVGTSTKVRFVAAWPEKIGSWRTYKVEVMDVAGKPRVHARAYLARNLRGFADYREYELETA